MTRLDGRVALVTGAGRVLRAPHARALAAHGVQVVVHDAVVAEIAAAGGDAVASNENLETAAGCVQAVEGAVP
jgi:NAD(P)-dependent dehydrogenase (short-subunit alcohol dehydrogenase family)